MTSAQTVIVNGIFDVNPDTRDRILAEAGPLIAAACTQDGCHHYAWTADLCAPSRIYVYEEWASAEHLARHLAGPHYAVMLAHMQGAGITGGGAWKHKVVQSAPVYDETGVATAVFPSM